VLGKYIVKHSVALWDVYLFNYADTTAFILKVKDFNTNLAKDFKTFSCTMSIYGISRIRNIIYSQTTISPYEFITNVMEIIFVNDFKFVRGLVWKSPSL
jgi:hypothetical protein